MKQNLLQYCVVTLGLAAVAGCHVDQKKEVQLYRQVLDGAATRPTSQPTSAPVAGGKLTLHEAMRSANSRNEQLMVQGEDYVQALIDKDRAAAGFLPTVNLVPTYAGARHASATFDAPVSGQMNLFNGFRDTANVERAKAVIRQRRDLLLDLQSSVLLNVAQTYYQILRSEQSVVVLRSALATQEEGVRQVQDRRQAGMARPLDVATSQAQAAATRVALTQALGDVRNGRSLLSFLIDLPVGEKVLDDDLLLPVNLQPADDLQTQAQANRTDLAAAVGASEAARQNVQIALGAYYPSVSVNVNYFLHRDSAPSDALWTGLLQTNLPIFSAGLIEANVRTAWSQLRQAMNSESLLRRQITEQVQVALENLNTSRQQLQDLQVQLTAADEGFRQTEQSYQVGLATNLERLASQDQMLNAQLQFSSQQFIQKVLYLNLLRTMGQMNLETTSVASLQKP